MKLPIKYQTAAFCLFMSFFMSMAISFCLTVISYGLNDGFLLTWLPKYALSFAIAFPVSLLVVPLVRSIVGRVCL
ncbi:MAG: DUF2798 domain-containing protein [Candidatus Methanofastidiosa archaeon]|nr:DUF2798 domain-containing protein [Candidatus Methanofastidiosa archaeon]